MRDNTYIKHVAAKAAKLMQDEIDAAERIYDVAEEIHNRPSLHSMKGIETINPFKKTPLPKEDYPYDPVKAKELNDWLQSQIGL